MYVLSGCYVSLLLHNIRNAKNDFMFSLNLSSVDEQANILLRGRWIKKFGDPWSEVTLMSLNFCFNAYKASVSLLAIPLEIRYTSLRET